MTWAVIAPTRGFHRGALAGRYVGASGSASLGVGLGANALIGGWRRSIDGREQSIRVAIRDTGEMSGLVSLAIWLATEEDEQTPLGM
jgi:hypothetical protein